MSNETNDSSDRRQQILDAAMGVFSRKGFQQATNKDIADAAGGISPGLIYHYFKDKQDLFMAIIRERAVIIQMVDHIDEFLEQPPQAVLSKFGHIYLSTVMIPENMAFFRIVLSEISRFPQLSEALYRGAIGKVLQTLVQYLEHQIVLGRLRPHNTQIAARSFMGMFMAHIFLRELFRQSETMTMDKDLVVAQIVDTFLHGLGEYSGVRSQESEG
jgi:TetR/AcrR family transcriptional regulator